MLPKNGLMFRVLTNKFHKGPTDAFLRNIPESQAKEMQASDILSKDAASLLTPPSMHMEKIHYSWFLESFKNISKDLQPSVLASLPEAHAKGLSKAFNLPLEKIELASIFKRFLLNLLYRGFEKKEILPLDFLPENALTSLTNLPKARLVTVIDYLGLYDLSDETRHIVERNLLNSIYAAISLDKQQFLKSLLNQKEKVVTPRLDLENWNKDPKELEKILHKRGMIRLSRALSGMHPDFLWHVIHMLDSGRGQVIASYYKKEETPAVSQALSKQVLYVINYLNKKS